MIVLFAHRDGSVILPLPSSIEPKSNLEEEFPENIGNHDLGSVVTSEEDDYVFVVDRLEKQYFSQLEPKNIVSVLEELIPKYPNQPVTIYLPKMNERIELEISAQFDFYSIPSRLNQYFENQLLKIVHV